MNAIADAEVINVDRIYDYIERFETTFSQAGVGMAHVAPNGRWLCVNKRLCDIVGYTHEELLARTSQDITHPADLYVDLNYVKRMLANEIQSYSMEKRFIRKDRKIVWIELTVSLVRAENNSPKYFIYVIQDITKRKMLDERREKAEWTLLNAYEYLEEVVSERTLELALRNKELTQVNEQLQELNKLKANFTAMLVHDLKSPLTVIKGSLNLLKQDELLDEGEKQSLVYASERNADSMLVLINDMLEVVRSEQYNLELNLAPLDMNRFIKERIEETKLAASSKRIDVKSLFEHNWPTIYADEHQLSRAFSNILSNAIKFTTPEGLISIKASMLERTEAGFKKQILLVNITDTGPGIAPEDLPDIFNPYKRSKKNDLSVGVGLGLSIVRNIIDAHKGTISVRSELGVGTSFTITLPI